MAPSPDSLPEALASAIHEHYRDQAKQKGWTMRYDVPYSELPTDLQHSNLAAALRIPVVLTAAGLRVTARATEGAIPLDEPQILAIIEEHIELAAIAEHDGWMKEKLEAGWHQGTHRDDDAKVHPSLVPYSQLPEEEKEKDRSAVRNYPAILQRAGIWVEK